MKKQKIIFIFLVIVAIGVAALWLLNRGIETTDDAMIEAHTIPISPKVPGYITVLNVADNQFVHKGDVLVEIDPRDYELRRDEAKAKLASAEVTAQNALTNAQRQIAIGKAAGSQKDIDNAITAQATAKAMVDSQRIALAIAEKDLTDSKIKYIGSSLKWWF